MCCRSVLAAFEMGELKHEDADHERIIQEKFLKDTQFIKIMTAEIVRVPLLPHFLSPVVARREAKTSQ